MDATAHSLAIALGQFGCTLYFVSPKGLEMPSDILWELAKSGVTFREFENFDEVKGSLDILYVTRIQRERFGDELDYDKVREGYNISNDFPYPLLKLRILDSLPRVNELSEEVDSTPYALYFPPGRQRNPHPNGADQPCHGGDVVNGTVTDF